MKYLPLYIVAILSITGCRKRPDPAVVVVPQPEPTVITPTAKASPRMDLQFENVVNGSKLKFRELYTNANGDTFYVTSYAYYISNVMLTDEDGNVYKEQESYHLVDEKKDSSKRIILKDIPAKNWKSIRFMVGVDSARNVSGAQTGDLDPLKGMFWTWNTGYVMARVEGSSPQAGKIPNNLSFHLGGFSGANNVTKWIDLPLPSVIKTDSNIRPTIYIHSDIAEWFKTPTTIDFAEISNVSTIGIESSIIGSNYADMFSINRTD